VPSVWLQKVGRLNYDELLAALDWDKVIEAVHGVPLKQHDYGDVAGMLLSSVKKWGVKDYNTLADIKVEQRFVMEIPSLTAHLGVSSAESRSYGSSAIKGFIDLDGFRTTHDGKLDAVEVIDWKTVGSITPEKKLNQSLSWQGRIYAVARGASRYTYRLVQRDGRTAEVSSNWPEPFYTEDDVREYLTETVAARQDEQGRHRVEKLGGVAITPWRRNMPGACGAFGRPCEHLELCAVTNSAPRRPLALGPLSHSSCETFNLCRERYRLDELKKAEDVAAGRETFYDVEASSTLGVSFHAGAAEAWRQIGSLR